MEPIIDFLQARLRSAGASRWARIAELVSEGLPDDKRIGVHLLRKLAYGDRDNPGVQTIQPLLSFFQAVDAGERELPGPAEKEAA